MLDISIVINVIYSMVPVMFADPSSVKDNTMDVGVASPGATHFFLVR